MDTFPIFPAPWFEGTLDNPVPLRYAYVLGEGDRRGTPYRQGNPILERPDIISWPVSSQLSERGRNLLSGAVLGEIQVVEKGWSLEMGEGQKPVLVYTAEAAEAKARMDEYFRLYWGHRHCFADEVVEAREFVSGMPVRELQELLAREGDPFLAAVALGSRLASERVRVLGSLEEAVEEAARVTPLV